jgi:hypothetical protein
MIWNSKYIADDDDGYEAETISDGQLATAILGAS